MNNIICDKVIDVKETSFNEKNIAWKLQSFYILPTSVLITITLLKTVSIF